ncbi:MAG: MotA/TolQ/ExbB proton channel family protein [Wenzhouxiangellaceae bacterium]|nr:MotA/TolQ/ExbB proton channel family protein [Wenzhouxiangellaceae bacterium]MBS3747521.1 MotA/TolQ/ExbB proton channel family protein [Wenzhouxiangellaceae bacterium]
MSGLTRSIPLSLFLLFFATAWAQEDSTRAGDDSAASIDEPPVAEESSAQESAAVPAPEPQQPSLEQAYQREFAFLQGQKRDLEQRLARLEESIETEKSQLQSEIRSLESEVVEMRGRADRMDDLLLESERAVQAARENSDVLAATFTQADFTLEEAWTSELGDQAPGAEDVRGLFEAAVGFLDRGQRVWREAGEFFLADGTRVDGEIIHVGNIAAYGLSPRGNGALAPAGDGELKIWDTETAEQAEALAAGGMPDPISIFLFESLNAEVEQKTAQGLFETVSSGGVIGWIIFFLGLVGLVMVILRIIFLQRAGASTDRILDAVSGHVKRGDRATALEVLKQKKGSTARVVSATIRNLDRDREHVEDIVSESILHENTHLNRFGALIIVIAAVSPLLGLLGTVTGMIATFDVITEFGTGDPKLLSGGISIALVTTELGLIVAIPMLLFGNLLSGWAERIKDDMEQAALRVINQYSDSLRSGANEAS